MRRRIHGLDRPAYFCRGDKLILDTVAPLWNKAKNGVKVAKGRLSGDTGS